MSKQQKPPDNPEESTEKDKKLSVEEQLANIQRGLDEIPILLGKSFEIYDKTVNQRFETILKSGKASTGGGEGTDFFKDILSLLNKVTSGEQTQTADKELSGLANRIVTLSLRKTLKDVEKSVGAVDHVVLSNH